MRELFQQLSSNMKKTSGCHSTHIKPQLRQNSSLQRYKNLSYGHCKKLEVIWAFWSPAVYTGDQKVVRQWIKLVLFERWKQFNRYMNACVGLWCGCHEDGFGGKTKQQNSLHINSCVLSVFFKKASTAPLRYFFNQLTEGEGRRNFIQPHTKKYKTLLGH